MGAADDVRASDVKSFYRKTYNCVAEALGYGFDFGQFGQSWAPRGCSSVIVGGWESDGKSFDSLRSLRISIEKYGVTRVVAREK